MIRTTIRQMPHIVTWTAIAFAVLFAFSGGWSSIQGFWVGRADPTDIFEYRGLYYRGVKDGGLVMASESAYYRDLDLVEWHDSLFCNDAEDDDGWRLVSESSSERPGKETAPMATAEWTYPGAFPVNGSPCYMKSTITAYDRGAVFRQVVQSDVFSPVEG